MSFGFLLGLAVAGVDDPPPLVKSSVLDVGMFDRPSAEGK